MTVRILQGDCREVLKTLPDESVHCVVTSPPYWGLRDYGHVGQIGLERTAAAFVGDLVAVFQEVRRVLRADGTLWLVLDDSYATDAKGERGIDKSTLSGGAWQMKAHPPKLARGDWREAGFKRKDLIGIPWRVALALQEDGWWLRCDVIWAKTSCMPENVQDRPTRSHEYVFLLSKSQHYYYDADAVREPDVGADHPRNVIAKPEPSCGVLKPHTGIRTAEGRNGQGRNRRSVWTVGPQPFAGGHTASFPPALIEPCILAGCPEGGNVLDPFGGAGTTGLVADRLQRDAILIELNPEYAEMAKKRIRNDAPLFADVS